MIGDNVKKYRKKKARYRKNMSTCRHTHTLAVIVRNDTATIKQTIK